MKKYMQLSKAPTQRQSAVRNKEARATKARLRQSRSSGRRSSGLWVTEAGSRGAMEFSTEISLKTQSVVKGNCTVYFKAKLSDYIMEMVAKKYSQKQMTKTSCF